MKSYHLTVWTLILLFGAIMGGVLLVSFNGKSHCCKIDPAQIRKAREQAAK